MPLEYVLYTDESEKEGRYFSNFYGGLLVRSTDLEHTVETLVQCKASLHLANEVKWQRVTENYLNKYRQLMNEFLGLIAGGKLKVRIMFTQNQFVPKGLTAEQQRISYYLLYYQFIKHAFGLAYSNDTGQPIGIRINLDQLPENNEDSEQFKSFVLGLNRNQAFRRAQLFIRPDQIAEIDSRQHVLLQCLDIVLGAMAFRLNDKHKDKPAGQRLRGKRTRAKHALYEHIRGRITDLYPRFNIGETTSRQGDIANLWRHPYRHWKFLPANRTRDGSKTKRKK